MEDKAKRDKLISLLETLKRNLDAVPKEILKTKYKKPYDALVKDICVTAEDYVKQITLQGIMIRKDYLSEVKQVIEQVNHQSGLLKQISAAAFLHQNIKEIDTLALLLRKQIQGALEECYAKHMGLYIPKECFSNPPGQPFLYNDVTGCILVNDDWKPLKEVNLTVGEASVKKGKMLYRKSKCKRERAVD